MIREERINARINTTIKIELKYMMITPLALVNKI